MHSALPSLSAVYSLPLWLLCRPTAPEEIYEETVVREQRANCMLYKLEDLNSIWQSESKD